MFLWGSRHCGERSVLCAGILRRPPWDAVPSGGDGAKRGGCSRQGEADLAPTATGGHDHPPVSGVHCLPPLWEDPAAGTTPNTITRASLSLNTWRSSCRADQPHWSYHWRLIPIISSVNVYKSDSSNNTDTVMVVWQHYTQIQEISSVSLVLFNTIILIYGFRMTAGWCWRSRRSTGCWRLCRSSNSSLQKWPITFSWMQASL